MSFCVVVRKCNTSRMRAIFGERNEVASAAAAMFPVLNGTAVALYVVAEIVAPTISAKTRSDELCSQHTHAWRALARLHAVQAAEPLTQLFRRIHENYDDFVGEDLPQVFGVLGPRAIPALVAYLANSMNYPSARGAAAHSLKEIGVRHAEAHGAFVAALADELGRYADQDPGVNGFLIGYLLDLIGRAGSVSRRKSWWAADDRRAHRFLAYYVSWLNISVYLPADRSFRSARRVYHGQLALVIRTDERCSQHSG